MIAEGHRKDVDQVTSVQNYRLILAIVPGLLTVVYVGGVLTGFLPEGRKIDTVTLAIIVLAVVAVAALVRPHVFSRLKLFEVGGIKLEMVERVTKYQEKQGNQLKDIQLILPLLVPEGERKRLLDLAEGKTFTEKGDHHRLRSELRRLRPVKLIRMKDGHKVAELKDDMEFEFARCVELTDLGKQWVNRIKEMETPEEPDGRADATIIDLKVTGIRIGWMPGGGQICGSHW